MGRVSKRYTPLPPWQEPEPFRIVHFRVGFGNGGVNVTKVPKKELSFRTGRIRGGGESPMFISVSSSYQKIRLEAVVIAFVCLTLLLACP